MPPRSTVLQSLVTDAAILGGTGLLSYGAWEVYHPAGALVLGALLLLLGLGAAVRR